MNVEDLESREDRHILSAEDDSHATYEGRWVITTTFMLSYSSITPLNNPKLKLKSNLGRYSARQDPFREQIKPILHQRTYENDQQTT